MPLESGARQIGAALRQHIAVAAGIFVPASVALRHDHAADQAIEKIAIVADEQHRAGIIGQHVLEHVQRLHVEIVGRLVENQEIRRLDSACASIRRPRSPPDSLPSGVRACSLREQKVFHIADDVPGLAVDHHRVAGAAGQCFGDRDIGIEAVAMLIERGDRKCRRRAAPCRCPAAARRSAY